jgi:hypothetical protein
VTCERDYRSRVRRSALDAAIPGLRGARSENVSFLISCRTFRERTLRLVLRCQAMTSVRATDEGELAMKIVVIGGAGLIGSKSATFCARAATR